MRLGVACAAACALAQTVAAFGSDAIAPSEVMEWEDAKRLWPDTVIVGSRMIRCEKNAELKLPPRQVIEIEVEQTQTSCGYGVPLMSFARERRVADRGRRFKDEAQFAAKDA